MGQRLSSFRRLGGNGLCRESCSHSMFLHIPFALHQTSNTWLLFQDCVSVFVYVSVCVDPWSWWWEFLWWFGALATGQISIMGAPDWPSLLSDHLINNTRDNALYTETYTYIELIHTRPDTQSTYDTLTFLEPIIPKNTRSPPHCKQVTETSTVKHYNKPLPGGIHYLDNSWSTQ